MALVIFCLRGRNCQRWNRKLSSVTEQAKENEINPERAVSPPRKLGKSGPKKKVSKILSMRRFRHQLKKELERRAVKIPNGWIKEKIKGRRHDADITAIFKDSIINKK